MELESSKRIKIQDLLTLIHKRGTNPTELREFLISPRGISLIDSDEILGIKDNDQRHVVHHLAAKGFLPIIPKKLINARGILEKDKNDISPLEYHYLNYRLDSIPKEIWDIPEIKNSDKTKAHILSWASSLGKAQQLPPQFYKLEVLQTIVEENGQTPTHILARHGKLRLIPKPLAVREILFTKDSLGKTIFHALAESSNTELLRDFGYKKLPTQILDLEDNKNQTLAYQMLCNGGLKNIDLGYWSPERWEKICQLSPTRVYPLHMACKNGELKYLPNQYISTEELMKFDIEGQNAYHKAINAGNLHKVPSKYLSQESLIHPNACGVTPLATLAKKCLGWNKKSSSKYLESELKCALSILKIKEIKKLLDSGIPIVKRLCEKEINSRILNHLGSEQKTLDI